MVSARPVQPCDLPAMPGPISLGATVTSDGYTISTQRFADLALYLAHLREWVSAADACIKGRE